eukprot:COSAG01_NODE_64476_length_276_cov_0.864407_1_plen_32_part_10
MARHLRKALYTDSQNRRRTVSWFHERKGACMR